MGQAPGLRRLPWPPFPGRCRVYHRAGFNRPSSRRRGNVDHLARSDICECIQQLRPDGAVVRHLILGHVNDDDANSKLCDILLEFDAAIICDEKVELLLRYR